MALLKPVHWEAISVQMQDILKYIGSCAWVKRFYWGNRIELEVTQLRSPPSLAAAGRMPAFPGQLRNF